MRKINLREANTAAASQEFLRTLWNTNIYYPLHNSPPVVPILSQTNSIYNFPNYFFNIDVNVTLLHKPRSSS
jgi:hypothetical protein